MNNLNSILIEGNLVRDAEIRTTTKGTTTCTFTIATNRFYKKDNAFEKEVNFFNVETWANVAESAGSKGKKGRGVRVVGRLRQERYEDRDGKTQSKVVIVAEHVEFRPETKKNVSVENEEVETCENVENLVPTF